MRGAKSHYMAPAGQVKGSRIMFVKVGKRYINFGLVLHILEAENLNGSHSYRFVFVGEACIDYVATNIDEITSIRYAIAVMGRNLDFDDTKG